MTGEGQGVSGTEERQFPLRDRGYKGPQFDPFATKRQSTNVEQTCCHVDM